ncbi:MAG: glycosyltransferase family 2 protein [Patescibacteria group bacterium]|nr:glycosyltransferase family 2 protein [Patescibacteria group bacterium]
MTSNEHQIPEHRTEEFGPKSGKYCLCVFVINEGERVRRQLAKMQKYAYAVDIVIADGGSTDGSLDEEYLRKNGVRALLTKTGPGKLSAQMRMGFAYAMGEGYDSVIVMDGNDKDGPEAIPRFVEMLNDGWDHVQGSRYIPGGHHANTPLDRMLAVRLVHAPLMSLFSKFRYTDTTNGFRAYSRKFLLDPRVQPFRDDFMTYELHYYLAHRAPELGFRTKEIPVSRVYPSGEATPTKIHSWRGKLDLMKQLLSACTHKYDPKQ